LLIALIWERWIENVCNVENNWLVALVATTINPQAHAQSAETQMRNHRAEKADSIAGRKLDKIQANRCADRRYATAPRGRVLLGLA